MHCNRAITAANPAGLRIFDNFDAFAAQIVQHDGSHFRVILAHRLGAFDHRDFAAKSHMRLCHLHTDGTAAHDQQVVRLFAQIENRLVGVNRYAIEPINWRNKGAGPGGDNETAGLDDGLAGLHFCFRDETRVFADDCATESFESFLTIDRGDCINDAAHMILGTCVVNLWMSLRDAEVRIIQPSMSVLGRRQQRL